MATQEKIQGVGIDQASTALLGLVEKPIKAAIHAKWFTIRITPDLASGELFNVGIGIIHRKRVFTKILPGAEPFKLLYGQNGLDNFGFLLNTLKLELNSQNWRQPFSPHIQLSRPQQVAGDSVEEMLNRLYHQMVTLDRANPQKPDTKANNISTENLRKAIFAQFKSNNQAFAEQVWHNEDNPIIILPEWGESATLNHIQLWTPPDLTSDTARFGSLVSMDYQNPIFSELYLLQANQDIQTAATSITKKKKQAGLFVYRPSGDTSAKADNLLDRTQWLLKKQLGTAFHMEVESNISKLGQQARAFAA